MESKAAGSLSVSSSSVFARTRDQDGTSSRVPFLLEKLPSVQESGQSSGQRQRSSAIWRLTLDLPGSKVNKLGREVMDDFGSRILPELERLALSESEIDALILVSGKPGNFIAGADIELIQSVKSSDEAEQLSRMGQELSCRWEDLPFPTVAAIDGAALGGGLELALASSALVVSDDPSTKLGLPEVMLGLIPGMGGCVRLPRKVGLATALDLILTGKSLSGERSFKAGLADALIPKQDFEAAVVRWVDRNCEALRAGRRLGKTPKLGGAGGAVGTILEGNFLGRRVIFHKAREGVVEKTRGRYPAPLEALDVLQSSGASYGERLRGTPRQQALLREAKGFGTVAVTEVSKNLIKLFFLTEGVKKSNGIADSPSGSGEPVEAAGVLGAGVMGGGIAQLFADRGLHTRMKDLSPQALQIGTQTAATLFKKQVRRRKISSRQMVQKLNLIAPTVDYHGFKSLDLVVEAIVENLDVKKKVLRELEDQVPEKCVIASNTSSLSISEMQKAMKDPSRFVGMHFFNPVSKMPLVEVIRGEKSSDYAVSTVFQLAKRLGKTPIVVKDSPGFLVNRLLAPYMNEASWMMSEGVPIPRIDEVLEDFGMPMGPLELMDEVGIDVGAKVAHVFEDAFGSRMKASPAGAKVLEAGRLGKKSLKGLYSYENVGGGKLKKTFEPSIYELLGVSPKENLLSDQEIVERCLLPQINEAAQCLEESVVGSADQVDLGLIMGTGFPPFRGGLLKYADSLGPRRIVERLKHFESLHGARFAPSEAILKRAEKNLNFHS